MRILFLYGNDAALPLCEWLEKQPGCEVTRVREKLSESAIRGRHFDLMVSFTYRYLLPSHIIGLLSGNAVNLHISFLPWNRGADPNLWSWIDDTPKGVTIHYINEKLDDGDIIAQELVSMRPDETLKSSYDKLMREITALFQKAFPYFSKWDEMRKHQIGVGSFHKSAELRLERRTLDYNMNALAFARQYRQEHGNDFLPC